ncbi:unnamed protein product [Arabidopsis thaliana]|nr:unnamed protein product [Arabidopsis thaliana]
MHQEEKKKKHRGGHWTLSEDLKLKELVAVFGPQNWKFIGEKMEPRTSLSCRQRWFNQLDPKINKRNFTDEEEEKLLRAHILYGNKWSKIAKLFNRRTDHAVKNHWHSLMNRIIRKQSASDIRSFDNIQNYQTSNFLPGSVSHESTNLNAQYLQEKNYSSCMPLQHSCHHHHFSTFPANSLALFTPHVSISQPSSSSLLSSSEAEDIMTTTTPRYIDFLGVGDS